MDAMRIPILLVLGFTVGVAAAEDQAGTASLGGAILADERIGTHDSASLSWREYRLETRLESKLAENNRAYAELWIRSIGYPAPADAQALASKDSAAPWNLDLREAYFDANGLGGGLFDLRMGRQRIAWGRGDKVNPTDNLNPLDLEDIYDFGRHMGSDAIRVNTLIGPATLTTVWIPGFEPAVLPAGNMAGALISAPATMPGVAVESITQTIMLPALTPGQSSKAGVKLSGNIAGWDLSTSYVYGRDSLPMLTGITLTPGVAAGAVNVDLAMSYPRQRILGADAAGSVAGIGVWGEVAVLFPDSVDMVTDMTALGQGLSREEILTDKPFTRWLLGTDYTFPWNIYLNAQYLQGFVHERGQGALNHYLMASVEWKNDEGTIKVTPLGIGAAVKKLGYIESDYGLAYMPKITWTPADNIELSIGYRRIEGKGTTMFGSLAGQDAALFTGKCSF